MPAKTRADIEKIWSNVEGVKTLSDRLVRFGPFGIGLDGMLAFIPGAGILYTVGAAAWLLRQGFRARATPKTLAVMLLWLGLDTFVTLTGETFFVPADLVDVLFPGHFLAAQALQKDIESTHWVEARRSEALASGEHLAHSETVSADPRLIRIVYLHD
jgi:hypothetical protein